MDAKTPRRTPVKKRKSPEKKWITSGVSDLTQPEGRFPLAPAGGWHGNARSHLRNLAGGWGKPESAAPRRFSSAVWGKIS